MTKASNACVGGNVVSLADARARLRKGTISTSTTARSAAPITSLATVTAKQAEPLSFVLMEGTSVLYSEHHGLVLSVDCPTLRRAYRIEWDAPLENLTVVYHWDDDCSPRYDGVSDHEHKELKAWLAANDDITDRFNFERDLAREEEDPR